MPPSIRQQITSAANAANQFVQNGGKWVTREVRKERLALCRTCPKLAGNRCTECGCFVSLKTWLPAEQCPLDPPRWTSHKLP